MRRQVCIVDDDAEFVDLLADVLAADADCIVRPFTQAPDPDELAATRPDLLLLDLRMGALDAADGWTLLHAIRERDALRDVPVILCSGDVLALREYAESPGADGRVMVLEKPFGMDELLGALSWACGSRSDEPMPAPQRRPHRALRPT